MKVPSDQLRVLHLIPDFWPNTGGMESFLGSLIQYGTPLGINARVLTMNRTAQHRDPLPPRETINGIDIQRLPFLELRYYKPIKLPTDVLRDADILHVHGVGSMLDAAVALRAKHGRPIVLSTHGGIFHTRRMALLKAGYFQVVRRFILPRVDQIVASSHADFELFSNANARTTVIENGVDLSEVIRIDASNDRARDTNRLLFVGRHSPNKRIDRLLDALKGALSLNSLLTLRLVGPNNAGREAAMRHASSIGVTDHVAFVGEATSEQLLDEYRQASVFISASEHEGFGIAAVEAMGAGCVAALSDIPPYRRLADTDGVSLIDFSDVSTAARSIVAAVANATEVQRASVRALARRFDWSTTIGAWRRLYQQLAAR